MARDTVRSMTPARAAAPAQRARSWPWRGGVLVALAALAACAGAPSSSSVDAARAVDVRPDGDGNGSPDGLVPSRGLVPSHGLVHYGDHFPDALERQPEPAYRLQPGDEIDVRDPDWPRFDVSTRVRADGRVTIPYAGTLQAAGLSPEELREAIRARLRVDEGEGADKIEGGGEAGGTVARQYLLQAGDEIELKFPYAPDVNERVTIRPDGWLQLQLIGALRAEGLSPEALQQQLRRRYAVYLRKPDLTVLVRSTVNQRVRIGGRWSQPGLPTLDPQVSVRNAPPSQVFIGGEVTRPGVFAFRPGLTLMQAAFEAGGRLPTADLSRVVVVRRYETGAAVIERDLRSMLARDSQAGAFTTAVASDVRLRASDVVVFPQSRAATVSETLNEYMFKNVPFLRNGALSFSYLFNGSQPVR